MVTKFKDPSQAPTVCIQYFGLDLPVTLDDLKSAFRRKAKELHTDVSGADTKEQFIAMKAAYDFLMEIKDLPGIFCENRENGLSPISFRTVDGTPLYELGLGLGQSVNGTDCPRCSHKGYIEKYGYGYRVCESCDAFGTVPRVIRCKYCANGKFKQRSGRIVDCYSCKGTGGHRLPGRYRCPHCHGTKTVYGRKEQAFYKTCSECNGKGEIPMWNPVLPKGRLGKFAG